jgi:orotidine-5'-phosphate decarboxylase
MTDSPLILALDVASTREAVSLCERVGDAAGMAKVGLELFVSEGPGSVEVIRNSGRSIFLDLKLHDIPETVDRAVARAAALNVSMLTVHASGGALMLERAVSRASREATGLAVVAVTVLTSHTQASLQATGVSAPLAEHVLTLAQLAWQSGVTHFVCSASEAPLLRQHFGQSACLITPGIRPQGADTQDQARVLTPSAAIFAGADWLVVGRPVRDAEDPRMAALAMANEAKEARQQ